MVVPSGISMIIEYWKLCRVTKVSFSLRGGVSVGQRNKEEQETDKLDAQFMQCLMRLMIPLCFVGALYSLLYLPHRRCVLFILISPCQGPLFLNEALLLIQKGEK